MAYIFMVLPSHGVSFDHRSVVAMIGLYLAYTPEHRPPNDPQQPVELEATPWGMLDQPTGVCSCARARCHETFMLPSFGLGLGLFPGTVRPLAALARSPWYTEVKTPLPGGTHIACCGHGMACPYAGLTIVVLFSRRIINSVQGGGL